jgi:hypothetical protein
MIRIAISPAAFDAIAATLPLGPGCFEFSMVKAFVPRYRYDQLE